MDIKTAESKIKKLKEFIVKERIKQRLNKPHCKKCLSGFVYFTKKGLVCRKCGFKSDEVLK